MKSPSKFQGSDTRRAEPLEADSVEGRRSTVTSDNTSGSGRSMKDFNGGKACKFVVHCLFLAYALTVLGLGLYQNLRPRHMTLHDHLTWGTTTGISVLIAGAMDIALGVSGLVGAWLDRKYLHWTNLGLLVASFLGTLIFLIFHSVSMNDRTRASEAFLKDSIVSKYGAEPDFTSLIDSYHKKFSCCGWTNTAENLYLRTPWHAASPDRNFPDTCCVAVNDNCRRANGTLEAVRVGYIYGRDCLHLTLLDAKSSALLVLMLMLIRLVAYCALSTQHCTDCTGKF